MQIWISFKVHVGRAHLVCPITECSGYLEESLVISQLSSEELAKYKFFLELSRLDSSTKPCPQCSLFTSLKGRSQQTSIKSEHKYKVNSAVNMIVNHDFLWVSKPSVFCLWCLQKSPHRFSAPIASLSGVLNAMRHGTKAWSVETTGKETNCCVTGPASSNMARGMLRSAHAAR